MRFFPLALLPLFLLTGCNDTPAQAGGSNGGGGGGGGHGAHAKSKAAASKERLAQSQHRSQKAHK